MIRASLGFFKRGRDSLSRVVKRTRHAPSMVQAMRRLVPKRVFRDVITSCSDRRQWGVVAAAWVGVSEREFARAAAEELGLEYEERVPVPDLVVFGPAARETLEGLRKAGAVPLLDGTRARAFIAIDPAEVRSLALYDGSQSIALAQWSDIVRSLDAAEHAIIQADASHQQAEMRDRNQLCTSLVEAIIREAAAHRAESVQIEATPDAARYRFTTPDGRQGIGVVRRDVVKAILDHLRDLLIPGYLSPVYGHVVVKELEGVPAGVGVGAGSIRLSWAAHSKAIELGCSEMSNDSVSQRVYSHEAMVTPLAPCPAPVSATEDITILVVDDNPMFCRVLERLLQRDGYYPIFACNGSEAWDRLSEPTGLKPSLIVCDLHMPVMNGEELLKRIRSSSVLRGVPIIMLTSNDDVNSEVALLEQGADAFVSKVRDPRVLCAQIRRLVEKRVAQEAA